MDQFVLVLVMLLVLAAPVFAVNNSSKADVPVNVEPVRADAAGNDSSSSRLRALLNATHVDVATDRVDALYEVGEPVTFVVQVRQGTDPADGISVRWELTNDGMAFLGSGTVLTKNGEARIQGRLDRPGFLRLQVWVQGPSDTATAMAAAGVSPHQIEPSRPVPDDFDAFWQQKKAMLAAVPPEARLTPVNTGDVRFEGFDVQVDSLGKPVSGYMVRPRDAQAGSLPAIITLHGAGVNTANVNGALSWAREGAIAMDINAHGIPNGQPSTYYTALSQNELAQYWLRGRDDREEFYFLGMFLRVIRAIDFITSQPEWDGKTVILYGTSQGGAQSLAGAGLDDRVSFFVAGVTGMADMGGLTAGRTMGWPNMTTELLRMSAARRQSVVNTLQYFDTATFAARAKAEGYFTVGFIDTVCAPSTVYTAYNALPNAKEIYNDIRAVHENTPEATRRMRQAVLDHMAEMNTAGKK